MANYIMKSRPESMLVVLLHDTPENREVADIRALQKLEADNTLSVFASMVDFDAEYTDDRAWPTFEKGPRWRECALAGDRTGQGLALWRRRVPGIKFLVEGMIARKGGHRQMITRASNLEPKGQRVQQHLQNLAKTKLLQMDKRGALRLGRAQGVLAPPLADLGVNTWPRADHEVLKSMCGKLETVLEELSFRLLDHVAVQLTGRKDCQIAVPLLDRIFPTTRSGTLTANPSRTLTATPP